MTNIMISNILTTVLISTKVDAVELQTQPGS